VGSDANVLIVEDEDEWRSIYERAVSSQRPGQTIKMAKDLAGAERLIDSTKFAVAFVDVGLDVADDQNVDGLRVMQKIRDTGDETSIVVVTGRSGQDVLSITRDAIKKYHAFDTIGKGNVEPSDIRRLLNGGLEAYEEATAPGKMDARDSIRGAVDGMIWDYQATTAVDFKGGIQGFYEFLDGLFGEYIPLIPELGDEHTCVDAENKIVYGTYWSRAVSAGVLICFAASAAFDKALAAISVGTSAAQGSGRVMVKELEGHNVRGAVFTVEGSRRDQFRSR
jgi:ActR/RegA family two-component response regulator